MRKIILLFMSVIAMTSVAGTPIKAVDRNNLDPTTMPGENFYQYACGGWKLNNPLDPQYARFGTFDQLAENSRNQVKEIITTLGTNNPRGSIKQKVGDLYAMGMDSVRLNKEGMSPLKAGIDQYKTLTRDEFMAAIADQHAGIASPFFNSAVMADLKDSNTNMMYLMQGGLGMGDRDYYLENDANTAKVRNAYVNYIQQLFQLIGYKKANAKKAAQRVMNIETALARVAMTREETRDYSKLYNVMSLDQLRADYPNINWSQYFAGLDISELDKVCVFQPKSLAKKMPRWKHSLDVPNTMLGEAVGQLYVEKFFPADSKKKMQQLVDNLKKALGEHIATLSWMSPKTKVNALVKLNSFTVKIGYPDKWRDYSNLDIDPAKSYWENVLNALRFQAEYEYGQLNKPVDKERWFMTPQTVNAYYEPSSNEICFPAGILQAPYFDPNADEACNYGAIGVVIGHEMTHGFDDQGRNFDHNGNMVDWWTAEDAAKFQELANKLGAQYSAEIVADDVHANGTFTMGENIADHGGLRVAYSAFKKTEQGKGNEMIDGFTPDQRFFLSYANVWAANITKEEMLRRTKVDPHSLGVNRVNVAIRNLEEFFNAFDIQPQMKMWRDPADRVIIW